MKNTNTNAKAEARTMAVVLEDIKANISEFNLTEDYKRKNELEVALANLETEYNELSLLNSWATYIADENPMVAFAKAYKYPTVGHKDVPHRETVNGVKKVTKTRVLDTEKTKLLNVAEFVDWTNERGNCVAHSEKWRSEVEDARQAIINEWKGFMAAKGDTRKVSIGKMKKALQSMIDALVFIEGAKGGNAVVATSDIAKAVFAVANTRKDGLVINSMTKGTWAKLQMDVLHAAVEKKSFTVIYGDEDAEEEADSADEAEAPKTEATAK